MQAIQIPQFGEPVDVARVTTVSPLKLPRGCVRVRMLVSPINPSDLMTIRGVYTLRPDLPFTPGYEGVGVVEESHAGLFGRFLLGKRVAVLQSRTGNWAEFSVASARSVIPLPRELDHAQAAMFFVNPATAYVLCKHVLNVPRGAWLVQSAAASAVGRMVIRLGKKEGFRTLNIVRREEQREELLASGADAVLVFDPSQHDADHFRQSVQQTVGPAGIRYAIDPVGGATATAIAAELGQNGHLVLYGSLSSNPLQVDSRQLLSQTARIEGFWLGQYMTTLSLLGKLRLIRELVRLHREGVLGSTVGQIYPLTELTTALKHAEEPGKAGKILLQFR